MRPRSETERDFATETYFNSKDPFRDFNYREWFADWKAGKKEDCIGELWANNPAMTALVIVQGSQDRLLTIGDCNEITNGLIERSRKAAG